MPDSFSLMTDTEPHPLCLAAAAQLQTALHKQDWVHNFGLPGNPQGTVIGKMFGVLVVRTQQKEPGYLAAFSGKLAGGNHHPGFVPPVFDALTVHSFLNRGMAGLTEINKEISALGEAGKERIQQLKHIRRLHSNALQQKLFSHYHFLNRAGESKSLNQLFEAAGYKRPPAGAGECAAPKLLQYAFLQGMQPLALAEFWWGQSPKSAQWQHRHFYPCCREKCAPVLAHMLSGINGAAAL